jgi:hypothetical protein
MRVEAAISTFLSSSARNYLAVSVADLENVLKNQGNK